MLIPMSHSEPEFGSALRYIKETLEIRQKIDFEVFQEYLIQDLFLDHINYITYLDTLTGEIPANSLPEYLDILTQNHFPREIMDKITFYLIKHKRPLFIQMGLRLVNTLKDPGFIPLIIDFVYSEHTPLQKYAIETVIELKGNAEKILESY